VNEDDRAYYGFLFDNHSELQDFRMIKITFGVLSSLYIASQVLRQVAKDNLLQYPESVN